MRQMVLVCDDSCNSFSCSPPPLFFPLGFPLVSLLFFTLKRPRCATQADKARESGEWASRRGHQASHRTCLHTGWLTVFYFDTACKFDPLYPQNDWSIIESINQSNNNQSKVGKTGTYSKCSNSQLFLLSSYTSRLSPMNWTLNYFALTEHVVSINYKYEKGHEPIISTPVSFVLRYEWCNFTVMQLCVAIEGKSPMNVLLVIGGKNVWLSFDIGLRSYIVTSHDEAD